MNKKLLIVGAVLTLLGLGLSANAYERHLAARDTSAALAVIDSGMDWDGVTPITQEERNDRLDANLEVWRTQKGQRNTRAIVAMLMVCVGTGSVFLGRPSQAS